MHCSGAATRLCGSVMTIIICTRQNRYIDFLRLCPRCCCCCVDYTYSRPKATLLSCCCTHVISRIQQAESESQDLQQLSPPARQHRGREAMPSNKHRPVDRTKKGIIPRKNEPKKARVNVAEILQQSCTSCVPFSPPHISTRTARRGAR